MSARQTAALLVLLAAALAAGCGKDDDYPLKVRETFTVACLDSSKDTLSKRFGMDEAGADRQAKAYCSCVLEKIIVRMPYKDFMAMNAALEKGMPPDAATEKLVEGIVAECGGATAVPKN